MWSEARQLKNNITYDMFAMLYQQPWSENKKKSECVGCGQYLNGQNAVKLFQQMGGWKMLDGIWCILIATADVSR